MDENANFLLKISMKRISNAKPRHDLFQLLSQATQQSIMGWDIFAEQGSAQSEVISNFKMEAF